MTRFWLLALLAVPAVAQDIPRNQREYETQPAPLFLFQWRAPRTHCDPLPRTGAYLDASPSTPKNVHRFDEMVLSRQQAPRLSLNVQSSITAIEGANRNDYSVRLCAEAGAQTESDANGLLAKIKLSSENGALALLAPLGSAKTQPRADLRIQAPAHVPVTVTGSYAALAVRGLHGAVKLTTTHGRITILDTTGSVEANANDFGMIDFSAVRGNVRLHSATELNVYIPAQQFDGTLEAVAERPVRVLLPHGFVSPFEAVVKNKRDFVCRADICGQVTQSKRNGNVVFTYGKTEPKLRFTSAHGPVVIDTVKK